MNFYNQDKSKVLEHLNSSAKGLSSAEAQQRLEKNGKNKLAEAKKISLAQRFLNQIKDPMLIILLVAAAVSLVIAIIDGEGFADVIIILAVVILNAVLGVIQESKAESALEALKNMTSPNSKVLRDGEVKLIKSEDIVVGDILILEAGDSVPADARIIECASIKCEESALTGESVPVEKTSDVISNDGKQVPLGDRKNMLYMGSTIVYGRGAAVVTSTGMQTEMGKIADVLNATENEETPLQIKLKQLSKILTYIVLGICLFIFGFRLISSISSGITVNVVLDTFIVAVSLAVAAIPEGLATVVTIVLSIGVTKMSHHKAVIRKLSAVETLGCTQIICSDKTGTLTQNKMTVVENFTTSSTLLATAMALSSDAELDSSFKAIGEPTECALVNFAYSLKLDKNELKKSFPRVNEIPFDSDRKLMTTVVEDNGKFIQYTKGAPDELLKRCSHYLTDDGVVLLDDSLRAKILGENKAMADKALRVLAAAYKNLDVCPSQMTTEVNEKDLIFIGLVGMIDPVRPEVKDAIMLCKSAGIRPIMITGDHKDTAIAIAKELEIISNSTEALSGTEIDAMGEEELAKNIEKYSVYARVQPEHKVMIVKAWKARDLVVAMTGDGVNDAPSIKSADIGVGMGITGTDVTKNVADMILGDDNFATIVDATKEGRRIYDNIKKAIRFLLSSNLSEVLSVFIATILGFTILKPVHILWINLITDTLPALALGMEDADPDVMERSPRPRREGIFSGGLGRNVIIEGIMISVLTLLAYFIGQYMQATSFSTLSFGEFLKTPELWRLEINGASLGMTMAFLTMAFAETFHAYNMRSQTQSIFKIKSVNKWMLLALIFSITLSVLVVVIPPIAKVFSFSAVNFTHVLISAGLGLATIPIVENSKLITRANSKKQK